MLLSGVFMVGPIVTFPTHGTATIRDRASGDAAEIPSMHWFGELPASLEPLKDYNADIFLYAKALFQDPDAMIKVYIRKVPAGFAGMNFASCSIIQYSDQDKPWHAAELVRYITHEMVHAWAYLGNEPDGYQNLWFIEGIQHVSFIRR